MPTPIEVAVTSSAPTRRLPTISQIHSHVERRNTLFRGRRGIAVYGTGWNVDLRLLFSPLLGGMAIRQAMSGC